jgi:hypothetical protein
MSTCTCIGDLQCLIITRASSQLADVLQDSDLNGVVAIRYTGGARMLLLIELGRRKSKMRIKVWMLLCTPHRRAEHALLSLLITEEIHTWSTVQVTLL